MTIGGFIGRRIDFLDLGERQARVGIIGRAEIVISILVWVGHERRRRREKFTGSVVRDLATGTWGCEIGETLKRRVSAVVGWRIFSWIAER